MAYDEGLADRIRRALEGRPDVEERHMFGGVAFMLRDHVCCGVVQSSLMVRLDPDGSDHLLHRPNVRPMDATGRPMRGFLFVDGDSLGSEDALLEWVDRAVAYAESMPDEAMDDDDESMPAETDAEEEPYEVPARPASMSRAAGSGGASRSGAMTAAPKPAAKKAAPKKKATPKRASRKAAKKKTAKKAAPRKAARKKTAKKSAARRKTAKKAGARRKKTTARRGAKKAARKTSGARRKKAARRPARARARTKRTARKKK